MKSLWQKFVQQHYAAQSKKTLSTGSKRHGSVMRKLAKIYREQRRRIILRTPQVTTIEEIGEWRPATSKKIAKNNQMGVFKGVYVKLFPNGNYAYVRFTNENDAEQFKSQYNMNVSEEDEIELAHRYNGTLLTTGSRTAMKFDGEMHPTYEESGLYVPPLE